MKKTEEKVELKKRGRRTKEQIEIDNKNAELAEQARQSQLNDTSLDENTRAEISRLSAEYNESKNKPKLKKIKEDRQLSEEEIKNYKNIYDKTIFFTLDFLAKRMPNPIPVSDFEYDYYSNITIPIIVKYMNKDFKYMEEINFGIGALMFVAPRMFKEKKIQEIAP